MKKEFLGVWIPKEIWENKELTLFEKVLLVEITYLDGKKGCQATNKYFAKFFGIHFKNISVHIGKLKEKGYIWEEKYDGKKRVLRSKLTKIIKGTINETIDTPINETIDTLSMKPLTIDNNIDNNINNNIVTKPKASSQALKELSILSGESSFKKWNWQDTLKVLLNHKRRDFQIIALYWQFKEIQFENKKQFESGLKRELRPAQKLLGYSNKRIEETMEFLAYDSAVKWTLETVHKYIDEDLNNLEPLKIKGRKQ